MATNSNPTTVHPADPARAGRPNRRHLLHACGLALTLALSGTACSQPRDVASASSADLGCDDLSPDASGEAVLLLGDGSSESLNEAIELLGDRPEQVFGTSEGDEEDASGIVVLATYDDAGTTTVHGEFDLRGVGDESTRREADAERQQRCLEIARDGLDPAPVRPEPTGAGGEAVEEVPDLGSTTSLLRALGPAAEQARAAAGDDPATVVVTGMSRSLIEGYPLNSIDLSDSGRTTLFDRMDESGLRLPNLAELDVAVVFLDPAEGVPSAIAAGDIEAFTADLCERIEASSCTTRQILG